MRILVLGASGMVGYQVFKACAARGLEVCGVVRNRQLIEKNLNTKSSHSIREIDDARNIQAIEKIIQEEKPDYVINAIGIVVQLPLAKDYYESVSINSLLPHQLEKLGSRYGFRLIQISTDCVFNGRKGMYKESDQPDAEDLYGKTKELGEVGYGCGLTLRASMIGPEIIRPAHGLLEWFLSQNSRVWGYTRAIFSGLTTLEFSRIILDKVIPGNLLPGIYHVSSEPIAKYDLLLMLANAFQKDIDILASGDLVLDRSLDSTKFSKLTGYTAPSWEIMIEEMRCEIKKG
ncbi:MAG: SDR family oxidoreductase [Bacteroidales bacterium]